MAKNKFRVSKSKLKFQKEFETFNDFEKVAEIGDVFFSGDPTNTRFKRPENILKENIEKYLYIVKDFKDGKLLFSMVNRKKQYSFHENAKDDKVQFFGNIFSI